MNYMDAPPPQKKTSTNKGLTKEQYLRVRRHEPLQN